MVFRIRTSMKTSFIIEIFHKLHIVLLGEGTDKEIVVEEAKD